MKIKEILMLSEDEPMNAPVSLDQQMQAATPPGMPMVHLPDNQARANDTPPPGVEKMVPAAQVPGNRPMPGMPTHDQEGQPLARFVRAPGQPITNGSRITPLNRFMGYIRGDEPSPQEPNLVPGVSTRPNQLR